MVDVGVDLLGGVETLDDVRQQLEGKLSWPFEVKPVSTLLVRVVVESPPDVSEEEVKRQVDDIIASADDHYSLRLVCHKSSGIVSKVKGLSASEAAALGVSKSNVCRYLNFS